MSDLTVEMARPGDRRDTSVGIPIGCVAPTVVPLRFRNGTTGIQVARLEARHFACALVASAAALPFDSTGTSTRTARACSCALGLPSQYRPATKKAPPMTLPSVARPRLYA